MQLRYKKLHPDAITPTYGTDGAVCFDIYSIEDVVVPAGGNAVYSKGLAFELPEGYGLMIYSRSGMGFNQSLRLANSVGVLDNDYLGELKVKLTSDNHDKDFKITKGSRIAQAKLEAYNRVEFVEVEEFEPTERGESGFGSTGA